MIGPKSWRWRASCESQYEGAIHYLMSPGDRREEIFRDHVDRSGARWAAGPGCHCFSLREDGPQRRGYSGYSFELINSLWR
jgi:hypothetical protein